MRALLCSVNFSLHKQILHFPSTAPVEGLGNSSTCREEGGIFTECFLKGGKGMSFFCLLSKTNTFFFLGSVVAASARGWLFKLNWKTSFFKRSNGKQALSVVVAVTQVNSMSCYLLEYFVLSHNDSKC